MAISFCNKKIFLCRSKIFNKNIKRNSGYIVLLPEVGDELPGKDPLLNKQGFPEFNTFTVEKGIAAVGKETSVFNQGLKKIQNTIIGKRDLNIINDVLNPLDEINIPLDTTWGIAKTLYFGKQSLMPKRYYQAIHTCVLDARSSKYISYSIYSTFKDAIENDDLKLTNEQKRVILKYILEGKLNGLDLKDRKKSFYLYYMRKITSKCDIFRRMVDIATMIGRTTVSNPIVMKDFSQDFLKMTAIDPKNPHIGPWKITLEPNIVEEFLKCCPDRDLRWNVWRSNIQRCSMTGENNLRTSDILEDIRSYRNDQAELLDHKTYAHLSMETKIAGSIDNIYSVMDNLLNTAKPVQQKEFNELEIFANNHEHSGPLKQWDIDYWIRKQCRIVYNFKNEILNDYFPYKYVLKQLFNLVEKLFDIKIVENNKTDVWHPDVQFYDIFDCRNSENQAISNFYIDPYARGRNKLTMSEQNAWMVSIRPRSTITNSKALVGLIFNFNPPSGETPSLLSFEDVIKLFQKFGDALQYLLTQVNYSEVSGASFIEWDAVGISGHLMVHWLYEPHIIKLISNNYKTNEPISDRHIESIQNSRKHMIGYKLCKEIYLGRLDLELHHSKDFWRDIMIKLYKLHFVIPFDEQDSYVTSWKAIFAENSGANYYSHLWSSIIAADVYSAFQEIPKGNTEQEKQIALRFRDTFLSLGGSLSAAEVFRRFRGRDPNSQALLKNLGLQCNDIV